MKIPPALRLIIKAILIPLVSVFCLSKFNLFEYISFIPKDKQFDTGLTVYLGIAEALILCLENVAEKNQPRITCVFYAKQGDKDIQRIPKITCGRDSLDVAIIHCELTVSGNAHFFKGNVLFMDLPEWLSSQVSVEHKVVTYTGSQLLWDFSKVIPSNSRIGTTAKCDIAIPLIRNEDKDYLDIVLRPTITKRWMRVFILFKANAFKICNKEQ